MTDLEVAKRHYSKGCYTCVLAKDDKVYTSDKSGIMPLLEYAESGESFVGFSAADKIVGKAAALLYAYLGVSRVYAEVMSRTAVEVFTAHGIEFECDTLTDMIINRRGDGACPMEQAVISIDDCIEALALIKNKLKSLSGAK